MRTSHVEACPEIGPICQVRDEPPQQHDQRIFLAEVRLAADAVFAGGWGASLVLPLRIFDTSIVFRDLAGRRVDLDYVNIHHRDETLVGVADPWLLGTWRSGMVGLRAGTTVPLGRTESDPFRAAARGEEHQHVQMGTGTFMPVLGASLEAPAGPVTIDGWGLAVISAYENAEGNLPGHRLAAGTGATYRALETLDVRLGGEVQVETAERWHGIVPTSDGNRGRVDVLLSGGAALDVGRGFALDGVVRVPIVTHVVGGQLSYPLVLQLGVSKVLDL